MSEIIKDSSSLEATITPFIDAANTRNWKHALDILHLNGAVLETPEGTGIPHKRERVNGLRANLL
jgi:hypothetical protein